MTVNKDVLESLTFICKTLGYLEVVPPYGDANYRTKQCDKAIKECEKIRAALVPRQAVAGDVMVYCVWRSDDESNHIFSTLEKANEYADSVEAPCVLSDYMIDSPQRHYERTN